MKVIESAARAKAGRETKAEAEAEAEAKPGAGVTAGVVAKVLVFYVRQDLPQTRAVRGIFHAVLPDPHPVLHHPSMTKLKTK